MSLEKAPNILILDFASVINPGSEPGTFIQNSSELEAFLELRLPLSGIISNLTLQNSFGFLGSDLEDVGSYLLKFTTANGFPFRVNLQAYFLDEQGTILDSTFVGGGEVVGAATPDESGNVVNEIVKSTIVEKNEEQIDLLRQATKMLIQVSFSQNQPAKIKDSYFLGVKLGAQVKLDL